MAKELVNEDLTISVTQMGAAFPGKSSLDYSYINSHGIISKNSFVDCPTGKKLVNGVTISLLPTYPAGPAGVGAGAGCQGVLSHSGAGVGTPISLFLITMNIFPGAAHTTSDGVACYIKGDNGMCSCAGVEMNTATGIPVPIVGSCKMEITYAGQNDASDN